MGRNPGLSWGPAEALETELRERREIAELLGQDAGANSGEAVRAAPIDRRQRLDETTLLKASKRGIQGPRAHRPTRAGFHVGHDRVAVFRPVAQADEDEERGLGEPAKLGDPGLHVTPAITTTHDISCSVI